MPYSLSRSQQVALAVTPKITGLLSALGSSWIVVEVLSQETKRYNVYNRILCAMSFFDFLSSMWFFASTWPVPEGTEGVAFATGNEQVCIAQGFFIQLGMASPYYNFCLALYYMLVVKYNVTEETLRHKFEPVVHVLCVIGGLAPAVAGVSLDLYNFANLWCWIAPYPEDCLDSYTYGAKESDCIRGDNAWIYRWAFFFGPLWVVIILVTIIMASVYRSVRKKETEQMADFYRDGQTRWSTFFTVPTTGEKTKKMEKSSPPKSSLRTENESDKPNEPLPTQQPNATHAGTPTTHKRRPSLMQEMSNRLLASDATMLVPKGLMTLIGGSYRSNDPSRAFNSEEIDYVVETIEQYTSTKHQTLELNQFGTQAVYRQFILYTFAFYASYTFATINRLVEQATGNEYFGLLFMHVTLIPLQGLFNVLIYRYGYYFRLKQRYPELTGWELFLYTWRWSFMGPPPRSTPETMIDPPRNVPPVSPEAKSENNGITREIDEPLSPYREVADKEGSDDGSEILNQNQDNILDDELTPAPVGNLMADMLFSYSEYPNMASGKDMELVTTAFPTMVGQYSDRGFTPPSPTNRPTPGAVFPTDFEN